MTSRIDAMPLPVARKTNGTTVPAAMMFVAYVVLADAFFGDTGLAERRRAERSYLHTSRQLQALRNENAGLREQVRRLQNDPVTIEGVARQDLGLLRPGELLFLIPDPRP